MRLPPARATFALAGTTAIISAGLLVAGLGERAALSGGFIAERLHSGGQRAVEAAFEISGSTFVPAWATPVSATLVHADLLHLGFNLVMLGFCGRFVEVAIGGWRLLLLYMLGAYSAAGAQYLAGPHSLAPMVGASGAISALLGAYALLFGEKRSWLATHRFGQTLHVVWLGFAWIGFQLLIGLATSRDNVGVATAAHVGGFFAGLAFARPLLRSHYRLA